MKGNCTGLIIVYVTKGSDAIREMGFIDGTHMFSKFKAIRITAVAIDANGIPFRWPMQLFLSKMSTGGLGSLMS
jgi:hypothetical protein